MTDEALHSNQGSAWQLLLQFVVPEGPAGERDSVQRVAEAVLELCLPPQQIEQIGSVLTEALHKITQDGHQDRHEHPVTVRVWVSDGLTRERSRFSSCGQGGGRPARGGWGFFVIEKHEDDLQAAAGAAPQLIELFLYQERERARQGRRTSQA